MPGCLGHVSVPLRPLTQLHRLNGVTPPSHNVEYGRRSKMESRNRGARDRTFPEILVDTPYRPKAGISLLLPLPDDLQNSRVVRLAHLVHL
jgi:hypothetical protein